MSKRNRGRYSIFPASALEDDRLGNAAIRVLALLGTYTDSDGWCNPKQATLAKPKKLTRQAISRQIQILVDTGYVEVEPTFRRDGGRAHNRYRVIIDDSFRKTMRRRSRLRPPQPGVAATDVAGARNLQVAARGNDPSFELTPLPPAERGEDLGSSEISTPRARGENPRAVRQATAKRESLRTWIQRVAPLQPAEFGVEAAQEEITRLIADTGQPPEVQAELLELGLDAWHRTHGITRRTA